MSQKSLKTRQLQDAYLLLPCFTGIELEQLLLLKMREPLAEVGGVTMLWVLSVILVGTRARRESQYLIRTTLRRQTLCCSSYLTPFNPHNSYVQ